MKIGDESDAIYCQVLGEYPGDDIIGMNAKRLRELAESDPAFPGWNNTAMGGNEMGNNQAVRDYMDRRQYKPVSFVVRAKIDATAAQRGVMSDENKIRFYIVKNLQPAHKEEFQSLADKLQQYGSMWIIVIITF